MLKPSRDYFIFWVIGVSYIIVGHIVGHSNFKFIFPLINLMAIISDIFGDITCDCGGDWIHSHTVNNGHWINERAIVYLSFMGPTLLFINISLCVYHLCSGISWTVKWYWNQLNLTMIKPCVIFNTASIQGNMLSGSLYDYAHLRIKSSYIFMQYKVCAAWQVLWHFHLLLSCSFV